MLLIGSVMHDNSSRQIVEAVLPNAPDVGVDDLPRYLNRRAASVYLMRKWGISRSHKTLAKLACIGGGPEMTYLGRAPMYSPVSLDAWVRSMMGAPVAHTSARGR